MERMQMGRTSALREMADLVRTGAREWKNAAGELLHDAGKGSVEPMNTLLKDIRYSLRMLLKTPVVSGIAALSLALGITATATMMSLANGFLFSSIPYPEGDELVAVWLVNQPLQATQGSTSPWTYGQMKENVSAFSELAAYTTGVANITSTDADPQQVRSVIMERNLLDVFRVQPAIGRGFTDEDAMEGAQGVVILLHSFWASRFQSDPAVLGSTIELNGEPQTIVGVMPESFEMIPANVHLMQPRDFSLSADMTARLVLPMGRLAPGVSMEQAQTELDAVQASALETWPETNQNWTLNAEYFRESFPGPTDTRLVQILVAVSLFGLLIACANVANLLLGRAEERQREVAVRTALGAGRGRILAQMLTESMVLALIAGSAGAWAASFLVKAFAIAMPPEMPRALYPSLTPGVMAAVLVVTLGTGLIFGLAPALHSVRGELRDSLGGSRGGTAGRSRKRLRNAFVIGEFAVALSLLTGAAVLMQAFNALAGGDGGFREEGIVTFQLTVDSNRYPDIQERGRVHTDLLEALDAEPLFASAAAMMTLPRGRNTPATGFSFDGVTPPDEQTMRMGVYNAVSEDYLATLDVPLLEGRFFTESDAFDGPPVAVISKAAADRYFPDESAVGRRVRLDREDVADQENEGREIIGVLADVAQDRLTVNAAPQAVFYVPIRQRPAQSLFYAVEVNGDMAAAGEGIRARLRTIDPTLPIAELQTLESHVNVQLSGPRIIANFLGAMGVIALLLAAMGIYGVMAHSVIQRTREIGIRMAMGAERRSVIRMVARNGMGLVTVGLVVGAPLAFLMYLAARSSLAELFDLLNPWPAFTLVAVSLAAVAGIACFIPALRASTITPVRALGAD